MKISGFTMGKNVSKLYYPIRESIESILPIVDEFIIALGDNDTDDTTLEIIQQINSPKIKIINTVWDIKKYPNGTENAHQTDIAMKACSGDWLFYLQADEVIHEKYLNSIVENCNKYLNDKRVEGFLFNYKHFFGDYKHYNDLYGWYPQEIRIVRNIPEIHSFKSAQSFRKIPNFDGQSYRKTEGTHKLNVVKIDAFVYHYGWVRPPEYMQKKTKSLATIHKGEKKASEIFKNTDTLFDYGNLAKLPQFKESHPAVMKNKIEQFNWAHTLHYEKNYKPKRELMKHEKTKSKILSFIAKKIFGNYKMFGHKNWYLIKN